MTSTFGGVFVLFCFCHLHIFGELFVQISSQAISNSLPFLFSLSPSSYSIFLSIPSFLFFVFRMTHTCFFWAWESSQFSPDNKSKAGVLPDESVYCWEGRSTPWKCVQNAYSLNYFHGLISYMRQNKAVFKRQWEISATKILVFWIRRSQ